MNAVVLNQGMQKFLSTAKWRPALQVFFTWLAGQDDEDRETEVGRVEGELTAEGSEQTPEYLLRNDAHWLDFFYELQKRGVGKVILGRHGRVTRFRWDDPPASLAAAALAFMNGGAATANATDAETPAGTPAGAAPPLRRHPFPLRDGLVLEVTVPGDVTREELSRLSDFIRLLPSKA